MPSGFTVLCTASAIRLAPAKVLPTHSEGVSIKSLE